MSVLFFGVLLRSVAVCFGAGFSWLFLSLVVVLRLFGLFPGFSAFRLSPTVIPLVVAAMVMIFAGYHRCGYHRPPKKQNIA